MTRTVPTAREQSAWDTYQRHGGDETPGAQAAAAKELGVSAGAIKSATDGYRRVSGLPEAPNLRRGTGGGRKVKTTEQFASLMERLTAVETELDDAMTQLAALTAVNQDLLDEVRGMLRRQPLILEVRPTHRRKVDGGEGGRREGRRSFRSIEEAVG